MVVQQILVDSIYRFSVAGWIFASAERGGQERRPKVSQPGESISFRFRGTTGWTCDLIGPGYGRATVDQELRPS